MPVDPTIETISINIYLIDKLLATCVCVIGSLLGYFSRIGMEEDYRFDFVRMVSLIGLSIIFGLGVGIIMGSTNSIVYFVVAGAVSFLVKELSGVSLGKIIKIGVNVWVCITRREKIKDEDM